MPAVSRAQFRKMKAMESRGEVSGGVAVEYTPSGLYARLPERKAGKRNPRQSRKVRRSTRR